jgi:hypothetical protein
MRSILHNHLEQVSYLSVVPNHVLLMATHLKSLTNLQMYHLYVCVCIYNFSIVQDVCYVKACTLRRYMGLMWSLFLVRHQYLSGIAPWGRIFIGNVNDIHG